MTYAFNAESMERLPDLLPSGLALSGKRTNRPTLTLAIRYRDKCFFCQSDKKDGYDHNECAKKDAAAGERTTDMVGDVMVELIR
jgi:hypothetical protein